MDHPQSRLTAQGQISVPAGIRRKLGVAAGSVLEWEVTGDKVVVRKATRYTSEDIHRAIFAATPEPRKTEEMDAAISKVMRAKHARR